MDELARNTNRVADTDIDYLFGGDDGSGEELEQERMALEDDSDDTSLDPPQIITGPGYDLKFSEWKTQHQKFWIFRTPRKI